MAHYTQQSILKIICSKLDIDTTGACTAFSSPPLRSLDFPNSGRIRAVALCPPKTSGINHGVNDMEADNYSDLVAVIDRSEYRIREPTRYRNVTDCFISKRKWTVIMWDLCDTYLLLLNVTVKYSWLNEIIKFIYV